MVEWAPLRLPLHRRLETLWVLYFVVMFVIFPFLSILVPLYLLFTRYWWITVAYLAWFLWDRKSSERGSHPSQWARNWKMFTHIANYFPLKLVKTADLSPEYNYIVGSHPHGIMSFGVFASFATEATGFGQLFPGIRPHLMTLEGQFWFPIRREYLLLLGSVASSRESLEWLLTHPGKGRAVAVVIGGAEEALHSQPGTYNLVLSKRRGFVRFALKHGAHLVPMYNFGETNTFKQVREEGGWLMRLQLWLKGYAGFSPPIFSGRGIFNYTYGILPYRTPIHSVVGKPIPVDRIPNPTEDQVDALHAEYCERLRQLFDENKSKYVFPKVKI